MLQRAKSQNVQYQTMFSYSFWDSLRQDLINKHQTYRLFLILSVYNVCRIFIKNISKRDNSQRTIPDKGFNVIFGVLASRPFKQAPTLCGILIKSRFKAQKILNNYIGNCFNCHFRNPCVETFQKAPTLLVYLHFES